MRNFFAIYALVLALIGVVIVTFPLVWFVLGAFFGFFKFDGFFFKWADLWIGLYYDADKKVFYYCPIPMIGVRFK